MKSTADLADEHGGDLDCCETPFHQFGGVHEFNGSIRTLRCFEDNGLLRSTLATPGAGAVLVVDGGASVRAALLGDQLAQLAINNGWEGLVINGGIRDAAALTQMMIGLKALAAVPRRGTSCGLGEIDVPVNFGGITLHPGHRLFSDEDGIVVLKG